MRKIFIAYSFLFFSGFVSLHGDISQVDINNEYDGISEYERELYLTPAGKYTETDILANDSSTRSQQFKDFIASHDLHPKVGDTICPITLTKANPKCTWIIGGKSYQFCCPPCIDEFLLLAKEQPEKIREPEEYVKS